MVDKEILKGRLAANQIEIDRLESEEQNRETLDAAD